MVIRGSIPQSIKGQVGKLTKNTPKVKLKKKKKDK